jgi:predicted Zn-dependent protease
LGLQSGNQELLAPENLRAVQLSNLQELSLGESMSVVKRNRFSLSKWSLAAAIACTSLASVAQDDRIDMPDMGASADTILSRQEEAEYARALIRQMRAYEVLNEDPLINAFFSDMGFRLVSNSDRPDKAFTFVIIDQPIVNAFAAPGGVVALYSGLILSADDENEVAGVLAHEVAHITQQHLYRAMEKAQAMTIPLALAMLGLILVGGGSGEAIQGALMGGQAAAVQAQINFTRHNEYEADRIGIRTLHRSGYDPRGMAEFFEKMGKLTRAGGEGPPEYLRTHPVSVSRISEAENRVMNMPEVTPGDGKNFYLAQARLRAMIEDQPSDAIEHFENRRERADIGEMEYDAIDYGMAIALQRKSQFDEARLLLQGLMGRDQHVAYDLQLADLDMNTGNMPAAIERLGSLYNDFPGNHIIAVHYSEALLRSNGEGEARKASSILRLQLQTHEDNPTLYELYARSANLNGDEVRASESMAEAHYLRGRLTEAVVQLQTLIRRNDLNYYQRARITDRLNELQMEVGRENA